MRRYDFGQEARDDGEVQCTGEGGVCKLRHTENV